MEKNKYTRDFEKFVRQALQGLPDNPDASVWSNIAQQQSRKNAWLRLRYYAPGGIALLAIVLLSVIAWHRLHPAVGQDTDMQPPIQTTPNTGQAVAAPGRDIAPLPGESDHPQRTARRLSLSGFAPHSTAKPLRAPWYGTNTVPAQQVLFQAEKGVEYRNPESGNSVRIPAGALVYADGRPVQGAVELLFREYRSIPDFLAAGMPMHFADAQGEYFFNSGGMFEVRVSQNNEDLFIAPGKTYDVSFVPTGKLQDANLFYLPDSTDEWAHVHDKEALAAKETLKVLSEADVVRDNTSSNTRTCLPAPLNLTVDYDPVPYMKESVETGRAYARGTIQVPLWFRNNSDKNDYFFIKNLEHSDIRVVRQNDAGERFFPDDLNNVFTELSVFKNCYFIRRTDSTDNAQRRMGIGPVNRPGSKKVPKRATTVDAIYRENRIWSSVEIRPEEGTACTVVLADGKDEIHLKARLAQSNEAHQGAGSFDATPIFAEYQRLRNLRHADDLRTITRWRCFIDIADMFQTEQEWCLSNADWFDYFEQNRPLMQARYDSLYHAGLNSDTSMIRTVVEAWRAKVRQMNFARAALLAKERAPNQNMVMSLSISGFGTHNWDQIFLLSNKQEYVTPIYKTPEGRSIIPMATRIINRETRLFFSMLQNDHLLKLPGRYIDLIVTGNDGRTYYMPGKVYAGLKFEKAHAFTFTMEDVTDRIGTPLEWAELLGI